MSAVDAVFGRIKARCRVCSEDECRSPRGVYNTSVGGDGWEGVSYVRETVDAAGCQRIHRYVPATYKSLQAVVLTHMSSLESVWRPFPA